MASPQKPKPAPKSVFDGKDLVSRKDAVNEAWLRHQKHQQIVIPGTGGKTITPQEYRKLLEKHLPSYKQTGSHISELERKNILRKMRREDKGIASRERRILEEQWGLKGKY